MNGTYKFAVPSSGFHISWEAHSSAISNVSWIDSPPSLLSASTDGVAKIWAPDGSCLLGQVGVETTKGTSFKIPSAREKA